MKTFKEYLEEAKKGRCWTGYKPVPGKEPYSPGSCEKVKEDIEQVDEVAPPGFEGTVKAMKKHKDIDNPWALAWSMKNKGYKSHKKADGSPKNEEVELQEEFKKGDRVRHKDGTLGTVTKEADEQGIVSWKHAGNNHRVSHKSVLKSAAGEKFRWRQYKEDVEQIDELSKSTLSSYLDKKKTEFMKGKTQPGTKQYNKDVQNMGKAYDKINKEEVELDETAAWQRKEGKSESGGLNQKGVESYRRENPGSKLKTAVTTKPSKLKPGSKAANRRKSFCARMSGMKKRLTSAKTANDPDSRINKSLRKWNC